MMASFSCSRCGARFASKQALGGHRRGSVVTCTRVANEGVNSDSNNHTHVNSDDNNDVQVNDPDDYGIQPSGSIMRERAKATICMRLFL